MSLIQQNKAKLLYIAPESLVRPQILEMLQAVTVDCLAIDEAHCISAWGHDFRPEYRRLAAEYIQTFRPDMTLVHLQRHLLVQIMSAPHRDLLTTQDIATYPLTFRNRCV